MIIRRFIPLAALLLITGLVLAQPPAKKDTPPKKDTPAKEPAKPAPGSLEDTLEKSLRNSADIKAAEAKVREVEAELNRVRQQVLTKATALHSDLNLAKRMLMVAEQSLAMQDRLVKTGQAGAEGLLAAQTMIEKHKGEVEKLETELKSLRGEFAIKTQPLTAAFTFDNNTLWAGMSDGTVRLWEATSAARTFDGWMVAGQAVAGKAAPAVQAPMMERIKKLLDQEVLFDAQEMPIPDALTMLLELAKADIPLRDMLRVKDGDGKVTLRGKLTVGAGIQAVEDSDPNVRIVVRDYGLLLTTRDRVPEGALRVQDVWKGNYAELRKPDPKPAEKKTP